MLRRVREHCFGVGLMGVCLTGRPGVAQAQTQAPTLWGGLSAPAPAATSAPLLFDGVTVVDVERGKLIPKQRVVIVGNRIRTMGAASAVKAPQGAQVVDARGKYLIPGLWDMHVHVRNRSPVSFYLRLLANGITGLRNAGSGIPLDTLRLWRQEILAGTRVGPPRQILSGRYIHSCGPTGLTADDEFAFCVADSTAAVRYVDSLKAAGADMVKPRAVGKKLFFIIAAEARRLGIPFGGHVEGVTLAEAMDSGASILDHLVSSRLPDGRVDAFCWKGPLLWWGYTEWPGKKNVLDTTGPPLPTIDAERCQLLAARLKRTGTWVVPTLFRNGGYGGPYAAPIAQYFTSPRTSWDSPLSSDWLRDGLRDALRDTAPPKPSPPSPDSGAMRLMQQVGLPILAGTDERGPLQVELAIYVAEGLTPLTALQSATLNPAKALRATDSLGTVAPGKLADLVLLDANPLADITNTMAIRAVVANGRYFDRAALDRLWAVSQAYSSTGP